jgi:ribosome-binding factor A
MHSVMTVRTEQIASSIRAAVQQSIARGLNDPRIRGLISVTKVKVAPDLSEAVVYVSVLPEDRAGLTLQGLESAAGRLRGTLYEQMRIRKAPRLLFRIDDSLKKQAKLDAAIRSGLPATAVGGSEPTSEEEQPS